MLAKGSQVLFAKRKWYWLKKMFVFFLTKREQTFLTTPEWLFKCRNTKRRIITFNKTLIKLLKKITIRE